MPDSHAATMPPVHRKGRRASSEVVHPSRIKQFGRATPRSLSPQAKHTLTFLFAHAHDNGTDIWCSVETLMDYTGFNRRSQFRALKELIDQEYLVDDGWKDYGHGLRTRRRRLDLDRLLADRQREDAAITHSAGSGTATPEPHSAGSGTLAGEAAVPDLVGRSARCGITAVPDLAPKGTQEESLKEPIRARAQGELRAAKEAPPALFSLFEEDAPPPPPYDPYDPDTPPVPPDRSVFYVRDDHEWHYRQEKYRDAFRIWDGMRIAREGCVARGEDVGPLPPEPLRPTVPWLEKRRLPGQETQQPPPPGWTLPFNRDPARINHAPIPPEPTGDPKAWMPRLSHPEHKWAVLAPGAEIDPQSMNGGRLQYRGGWHLRGLALSIAEILGWHDLTRYTDWRPLCAWLDAGIDPHDTILPVIRRVVERRGSQDVSTLAYFDGAVRGTTGNRRVA